MSSGPVEKTISPREIASYFDLEACDAYLNLEKRNDNEKLRDNASEINGISPLYNQEGTQFEIKQLKKIQNEANEIITERLRLSGSRNSWPDDYQKSIQKFEDMLQRINSEPEGYLLVIDQAKFSSTIHSWTVRGISDLVLVWSTSAGVHVHIVEIKSSYSNRTAFKIQAATYLAILKQTFPASAFSFNVEFDGVIVSREEDGGLPNASKPDDIDTEDLAALERTVYDFLADDGGAIGAVSKRYSDLFIRLSSRCSRCKFQPVCLSSEIYNKGLGLLQLDIGTQDQLADNNNVGTLSDLVDLIDWTSVHNSGPKAWSFDDIEFDTSHQSTIRNIQQEGNISDLRSLIQRAKSFEDEINTNPRGNRTLYDPSLNPSQIQGSGNGKLPIQDPSILYKNSSNEDTPDPNYPPNSIVKIHTSVIQDSVRDRVLALAARIESPIRTDAKYVVEMPEEISFYNKKERIDRPACEEVQLLVSFTRKLLKEVIDVAPDPTRHNEEWSDNFDSDDIFLHFYFYDRFQLTALIDSLRRHSGVSELDTLRSVLSLRSALADESAEDQMVYSIIDEELRDRFGMRFLGLGFVQTVGQFCDGGRNTFDWNNVEGYSGPDLTEIFRATFQIASESIEMFPSLLPDYNVGLKNINDDPSFTYTIPFINLHSTTVPIEYFYALHDMLDDISGGKNASIADPDTYRYRTDSGSDEITTDDMERFLKKWTKALSHIENEIGGKAGYNAKIEKSPFNIQQIMSFSLRRDGLSTTVLEYLLLEDEASDRDLERFYRSPADERIRSGKSVGGRAEIELDEGYIRATLLGPDLQNPLSQTVNEFPLSVSEGDWMVLTPLNDTNSPRELGPEGDRLEDRSKIKHSPIGIIEKLDEENDMLEINLIGIGFSSDDRCVTWHRNLDYIGILSIPNLIESFIDIFGIGSEDDAENNDVDSNFILELDDNQRFVLDPMYDDIGGFRAAEALDRVDHNNMYQHLADLYQGRTP